MPCPCSVPGRVVLLGIGAMIELTNLTTGARRVFSGEVGGGGLQCVPLIVTATKLEATMACVA